MFLWLCVCVCSGKLYATSSDVDSVEERHRHRYEVNPKYVGEIEKAGLRFVGHSTDNTRMEICELSSESLAPPPHLATPHVHNSRALHMFILFHLFIRYCFFFLEHPYYVGVQYHPEYLTRPMCPSPPYLGLLLASSGKLQGWLSRGYRLSPRASYDYDSEDDEVSQTLYKSKDSCEDALGVSDPDDSVLTGAES